jgi:hypothetical protein
VLAASALSNDVPVSANDDSNGRPSRPGAAQGVLANLPRTRPQRASARRAAARRETAAAQPADGPAATPSAGAAQAKPRTAASSLRRASANANARTKPAKPAAKRTPATPRAAEEQVPRQGFESETDRARGPVQPPGGAELVASAAEIVGELARAGLSTGERLLRDALARLPLS